LLVSGGIDLGQEVEGNGSDFAAIFLAQLLLEDCLRVYASF
jgi:hypothetical protein